MDYWTVDDSGRFGRRRPGSIGGGPLAAAIVLSFCAALAAGADSGPPSPGRPAGDIPSLIRSLGSPDWHVRESAQHELLDLGSRAVDPLRKVLHSDSAEIVQRARHLLDRIDPIRLRYRISRILLEEEPRLEWQIETRAAEGEETELISTASSSGRANRYVITCLPISGAARPDEPQRLNVQVQFSRQNSNYSVALRQPPETAGTISLLDTGTRAYYRQIGVHVERTRTDYVTLFEYWRSRQSEIDTREPPRDEPGEDGLAELAARVRRQTRHPEPGLRRAALDILGRLRDGDSIPLARAALQDPRTRNAALLCLGRLNQADALETLRKELTDAAEDGRDLKQATPRGFPDHQPERERSELSLVQAAITLAAQGDAGAASFLVSRLGSVDRGQARPILGTLSDFVLASGENTEFLDRLVERLADVEMLAQAPWTELETGYLYCLCARRLDPGRPRHRELAGELLGNFSRVVFQVDTYTTGSSRLRAFLDIWDILSRRFDCSVQVREFIPRMLQEVRDHSQLSRLTRCFLRSFGEGRPLPDEVFAIVESAARSTLQADKPGQATSISGFLLAFARQASLSPAQLEATVRLLLDAAGSPRVSYRQDLLRELSRLTGIDMAATPTSPTTMLRVLEPQVRDWLQSRPANEPARETLKDASPAPAAELEYLEILLILSAEGSQSEEGGAVQVEVLDGRRLGIREGVPFEYEDRWGNTVMRTVSLLPGAAAVPEKRYRLDSYTTIYEGIPQLVTPRRESASVGWYESSESLLGSYPISSPLSHRIMTLVSVRPAAAAAKVGPVGGGDASPGATWESFRASFLESLSEYSPSARKRVLRLVGDLGLEDALPILKEAFRKNPDLELAKQLLPSGDPLVIAFLRSRFTGGSSVERTEAARLLAERGDEAALDALIEILGQRSVGVSTYRAIQGIESYLECEQSTKAGRQKALDHILKNLNQTAYQSRGFSILRKQAGVDFGYSKTWTLQPVDRRRAVEQCIERARQWWQETREAR